MYKNKGKWVITTKEINEIVNLYKTKSILYIAKQFKVDNSVIKRILLQANIKIKNLSEVHRLPIDETFFNTINTEEKAYWLGFIYADGYITKHKNTKTFGVKLKFTDIKHLQKLKNSLKSTHKIVKETINSVYGNTTACALCISNNIIVDALYKQGVLYNKSKILLPPTTYQVPENLIQHFIRGYFDGDGSIYSSLGKRSKTITCYISFVGTKEMLLWILQKLKTVCNTKVQPYKYKNKDIYELSIGGNKQISLIYKYLYNNATVFLERKRNKFEDLRRTFNDYNSPSQVDEGIV